MTWKHITTINDINAIIEQSHNKDILLFKHSTSCSISSIAKYRIESDWDFHDSTEAYYLDLISYREVSNFIADHFAVPHESPQVLLIRKGECFFDTSHLDITITELHDAFAHA